MSLIVHNSLSTNHYPSAQYYPSAPLRNRNSDLSIWISVDPMVDKYPNLSPYVYCVNNPVRLVDPKGKEIGDYFNQHGKFLGTDCTDDGRIYIFNDNLWNKYQETISWQGGDGTTIIASGIGNIFSQKPSEANLSEEAIFNIVNHYNSTSLPLQMNYGDFGALLLTTIIYTIDGNGKANTHRVELLCNTSNCKNNMSVLDNYHNIRNSIEHESNHINSFNTLGGDAYLSIPSHMRELEAIEYQQSQPSYKRTSMEFKRAIMHYYYENKENEAK